MQRAEPTVTLPPWSIDEAALLRHAGAGDPEAFRELVLNHQASVFGAALRLTGERAAAVGLAQEVFVALHAAVARIRNPAHLARWLARAVTQRAVEYPAASAAVPDAAGEPGPEFTAGVMVRLEQRRSHRRRTAVASNPHGTRTRRRLVWASAWIALAVALLLVLQWSGLLWPAGEVATPEPAANIGADAPAPLPSADGPPVQPADSSSVPGTASSASPAALKDLHPQYTLIVMPLHQETADAAARAPAEAFHAALLDELRKVPGLTLLVPGVTAAPVEAGPPADYLLTVISLQTTALPAGGLAFRVTTAAAGGAIATGSGQQWPVQLRMQPLGQPQSGFASTVQLGAADTVAQLAAQQVQLLRVRFFPDALIRQQLVARLRADAGAERERALSDLIGTQVRGRGSELDAASILAIVQQAATLRAEQRARLWRDLRGSAYPELVDPLLDSLRRDPETDVRFEALMTLAADHAGEPRVRAAIESAAREDPEQVVRMAARRTLDGDAGWRAYVLATLADGSLPYAQRLAPLLLAARSATTAAETLDVKAMVNDPQALQLLAAMVSEGWFDAAQSDAVGDALGLLADGGSPAVPGLLVQVMQESPKSAAPAPSVPAPASGAPAAPQVSAATMAWLLSHRGNPLARRMLDDIARGNPDPRLEIIVEQMRRAEQLPPPSRRR